MRIFLTLLLLLCFLPKPQAQTFTGSGGPIPDDGNSIAFPIQVAGLPAVMDTLNFGLEQVCLSLTHTWNADLAVFLQAPDGALTQLFAGIGGDTDGFENTCLSGNATSSIYSVWHPFTGVFRPQGDMGLQNNGQNPNGLWQLVILDTYAFADAGELFEWSITFGNNPCKPFVVASSDLPILKINTNGTYITDEPKVDGIVQVIDNGPGQRNFSAQTNFAYEGPIGIETHGNSSQGFPKKSFKMETRGQDGEDLDVSLMGLPETSDFVLLANFSDKTLLRNALTYQLARETGHYAPRTRFCEVFVNDAYQGVYNLTERIKRGSERVNIAKLKDSDISGVDLTGGYIVSVDWGTTPGWYSQFSQPNSPQKFTFFQHEYPRADEILPEQSQYIQRFVDSFEVALAGPDFQHPANGWRDFADEKSFIDYMLLNELGKNVDGYRLSTYFYKDRDDKDRKIHMGPAWDFDLAWFNADYCDAFQPSGWAFNLNYVCPDAGIPFWWERLAEDTLYVQHLACRWNSLRQTTFSKARLAFVIDSMAARVQESQARNFSMWPILGSYIWPNPAPIPDTYSGEIQKLKGWIDLRINWLDQVLNAQQPQLNATFSATANDVLNWHFQAAQNHPDWHYHWDFGDGTNASGASPTHTFANLGTYTVQLSVSTPFGCSQTSGQIIHVVNTATVNIEQNPAQVTPNPASDVLQINWANPPQQYTAVQLINALGQVVAQQRVEPPAQQLKLSVAMLPPGAYNLNIVQGNTVTNRTVIVEKR